MLRNNRVQISNSKIHIFTFGECSHASVRKNKTSWKIYRKGYWKLLRSMNAFTKIKLRIFCDKLELLNMDTGIVCLA